MPTNLADKIEDGVISLASVPTDKLKEWAAEAEHWQDKDAIGCELMYRVGR